MSEMTDFLEDELLNHTFRNVTFTSPTTVFAALFTSATDDTGGGTEVATGSYARQAITFGAPSPAGTIANSATITFPTATASWGTVTHFAIFDAVTTGNMLMHSPLNVSKTIDTDDTAEFAVGALTVVFA